MPTPGMLGFLRRALGYLRPHGVPSLLILLGVMLHVAYVTNLSLSFKFLIDRAIVPHNARLLVLIIGGLALTFVVTSIVDAGRDYLTASVGARVIEDLRHTMFLHLQRLSMRFYAHAQTSELLSYFSSDLGAVEIGLTRALPQVVSSGLKAIVSATILFILDWRLALATTAAVPISLIGPHYFGPRAMQAAFRRKQDDVTILGTIQEQITAHAVIKVFGLGHAMQGRFREQLARLTATSRKASLLSRLVGRIADMGQYFLQLLIIAVGGVLAFYGYLSVGSLFAFVAVLLNLSLAFLELSQTVPELIQAANGMRQIDALLDEPAGVSDMAGATALPRLATEIRLKDVTFSYSDQPPNLNNISCTIEKDQSVAFVGRSGSGKSTVLNLLMRFYDPGSGSVTIDGYNLRCVTQESLYAQVGVVFQETFLFNTTIRENIRMGRLDASEAEVEAAARAAEIDDLIVSLPQGYDTLVGERGGRLSGGQRQRVALARALLRNPAILILDEATSALDPETERAINTTLKKQAEGRTLIMTTHRLASIAHVDCIFVLDHGQIVEHGTHAELLSGKGLYHHLYRQQSGFVSSRGGRHVEITTTRLRAIPLFANLDETLLRSIADSFVTERYAAGEAIVVEGELGDIFYIIVRGSAEAVKAEDDGRERQLEILQDGDFFGEIALLEDVTRTATVRTRTPTIVLALEREQFLQLLNSAPELRTAVMEVVAARRRNLQS